MEKMSYLLLKVKGGSYLLDCIFEIFRSQFWVFWKELLLLPILNIFSWKFLDFCYLVINLLSFLFFYFVFTMKYIIRFVMFSFTWLISLDIGPLLILLFTIFTQIWRIGIIFAYHVFNLQFRRHSLFISYSGSSFPGTCRLFIQ